MGIAIDPATGFLPPGEHDASWGEIETLCGGNSHRQLLLAGLLEALRNLAAAGCPIAYIDGSFVSSKALPSDYDGCWEIAGVDSSRLDPVLLDFSNQRAAMKAKYRGELFPAISQATAGKTYRAFFQQDHNGTPKGILRLDLRRLP